jgi:DNA-binding transcriptional LysR family regulator
MNDLRAFDMNLLTVFEAIYESGTVSRGAERLGISQAAGSHALARLRDACGDDLFVRAGAQFQPTPIAQALFPSVKQALRLLRAGLGEARGFDPTTSERRFKIAIPHPLGPMIAETLRVSLTNAAPHITLRWDTKSMPADFTSDLRDGTVDLAIDWLRVEHDQFVNSVILGEELCLMVRRGHPRITQAPTLEQMLREEFVWLHPRRPRDQRPEAARQVEDMGMNPALLVSEWLEVPTIVAMFDLLGIVPWSLGRLLTQRMALNAFPFPAKLTPVPIFAVWHESRRNDSSHRWLRDTVAEELLRQASYKPGQALGG